MDGLEEYDHSSRDCAMTTLMRLHREERIPVGLIYRGEARTLEDFYLTKHGEISALKRLDNGTRRKHVREILRDYGFK